MRVLVVVVLALICLTISCGSLAAYILDYMAGDALAGCLLFSILPGVGMVIAALEE